MIPLSPQNEPMTLHEDHATLCFDFSPQKRYHMKGYPKNKEIIKVMKKKTNRESFTQSLAASFAVI